MLTSILRREITLSSGLYGIEHSNRSDAQHWTKNCFNSSFPTSLACYMMENKIPAIYAKLAKVKGELKIVCESIPINELFRCKNSHAKDLQFDFESKFEPYQNFSFDPIDGIDLVVRDLNGKYLAPIEVKLTVLPTSATACKPENEWGSELVVRTATTSYCAFAIWDEIKDKSRHVREIFEDTCSDIGSWTNDFEMSHKTANLRTALNTFESEYIKYQTPLVMQPLWKTQGQSPVLCDNAFDIVVWSNLAFSRLFIETSNENVMSRPMRASARMARCIWELSKSGKIRVDEIYRQMAFGQQTDKEVSVPGDRWRRYITSDRIINPAVSKTAINEIISSGYIENLRPERRFDQTLYFTMQHWLG
jgi:hypothetical protein